MATRKPTYHGQTIFEAEMTNLARDKALERANGNCEVMVQRGPVWYQCDQPGTDVHHMLPRSRGGLILDKVGESDHLVCVCRPHHRYIHGHPHEAEQMGLTIDGYVVTGARGKPRYVGADPNLAKRYGNHVAEQVIGHRSSHHSPPRSVVGAAR